LRARLHSAGVVRAERVLEDGSLELDADLPEAEAAELQRLDGVEIAPVRAPQPSSPCTGDEPYLQSTRATRLA
jgi:hypothetical protein